MNDIHALSGAYAVDALSDAERADFELHLAECPTCRAEVDSLREAAALLPSTVASAPTAALRASVLAAIGEVRPLPPLEPDAEPHGGRHTGTVVPLRRRRRFQVGLVAAAAAVIAVVGGVTITQLDDDAPGETPATIEAVSAENVLAAPDVETIPASGDLPDGTTATVHYSDDLGRAVIVTAGMPAAAEGTTYELWLKHGDKFVPAGLMGGGKDETILLDGDASAAEAVGITVEPAGGSQSPTFPPVALFSFEDA